MIISNLAKLTPLLRQSLLLFVGLVFYKEVAPAGYCRHTNDKMISNCPPATNIDKAGMGVMIWALARV